MEGGRDSSSEIGGQNSPESRLRSRLEIIGETDKVRKGALQELRCKLQAEADRYGALIKSTREKDSAPVTGSKLRRMAVAIDGYINPSTTYDIGLQEVSRVIKAIDQGNTDVATKFLVKDTEWAIYLAYVNRENPEGSDFIKKAKSNIGFLGKISPTCVGPLQQRLDGVKQEAVFSWESSRPRNESLASKLDRVLFGPNGNKLAESKIPVSVESGGEGIRELRDRLLEEINVCRNSIKLGREKDEESRFKTGLRGALVKIDRMLFGSYELNERQHADPKIADRRRALEAINLRGEDAAAEYLARRIDENISRARVGVIIAEDREIENRVVDEAQQMIDILAKIRPKLAGRLQKKLDKNTGNPLNKF